MQVVEHIFTHDIEGTSPLQQVRNDMRLDMIVKKGCFHSIFLSLSKATNDCRPYMRAADSLIGVSLSVQGAGSGTGKRNLGDQQAIDRLSFEYFKHSFF